MNILYVIQSLFSVLRISSWGTILFAVLTGLLSGTCSASLIALVHLILSDTSSSSSGYIWYFGGLALIIPITNTLSQTLMSHVTIKATHELRLNICRQILSTPLRDLETLGPSRLLATITEDIARITNAAMAIPSLCVNMAVFTGCVLYLGWLSWSVFLLLLCFIVPAAVSVQFLGHQALKFTRHARESTDQLFKHLRSLTDGLKELKNHKQRREAFFSQIFQPTATELQHHNVKADLIINVANNWGQLVYFIIMGLLLFVVPSLQDMSLQVLTGYMLVILYGLGPYLFIMNTLLTLNRSKIAVDKIDSLGLSLSQDYHATGDTSSVETTHWKTLELLGVVHAYSSDHGDKSFSLGPINMAFQPGESVFLIGANGSGKTTLAKLLSGLYTPEEGEIRLDGIPVTAENLETYRQHFSIIFSDFYLFESLLGLEKPRYMDQAQDYLVKLQLDHKVRIEEGVFSTTDLSRGQRKRLALLVAYMEDRPFYIFDEWAADQDPVFKDLFYTQLLPELKSRGKTLLVICHDDRYFHLADRVIKLDFGQIYDHQAP